MQGVNQGYKGKYITRKGVAMVMSFKYIHCCLEVCGFISVKHVYTVTIDSCLNIKFRMSGKAWILLNKQECSSENMHHFGCVKLADKYNNGEMIPLSLCYWGRKNFSRAKTNFDILNFRYIEEEHAVLASRLYENVYCYKCILSL